MDKVTIFFAVYFVLISAISSAVCVFDKSRSKRGGWRVRESTLMMLSLLGGAAAMLFTMKTVRHKTKHKKFTVGLPLIIVLHIIIAVIVIFNLDKAVI